MISRFTVAEGLWPIKILYNHLILKILYIMTPGTEQVDIKWILGISAHSQNWPGSSMSRKNHRIRLTKEVTTSIHLLSFKFQITYSMQTLKTRSSTDPVAKLRDSRPSPVSSSLSINRRYYYAESKGLWQTKEVVVEFANAIFKDSIAE